MLPTNTTPKMRDVFRGIGVWAGLAMAAIGWIAIESGSPNSGFTTFVFLGGFQAGMSAMANIWMKAREDWQAGEPPSAPPSD